MFSLLPALPSVALPAEHLTIRGYRVTSIAPRLDMVGFHLLDFEMIATNSADAVLPFVHLSFGVVIEGADVQMTLVAIHHIPIDAAFVLHIAVFHQFAHTRSQLALLIGVVAVQVVHLAPLHTLHLLADRRLRNPDGPCYLRLCLFVFPHSINCVPLRLVKMLHLAFVLETANVAFFPLTPSHKAGLFVHTFITF